MHRSLLWPFLVALALAFLSGALKAEPAARIIVAGGDLTEIVYALGEGDRIVGVDSTSTYPPEARRLPQIGYVRALSPEGLLSMTPDMLLAAHDARPQAALDLLSKAGVLVAAGPRAGGVDDIPAKIRFVADAIDASAAGDELVARFETDLARVRAHVAKAKDRPRVLFILSVRDGAPLVAGADTAAHVLIEEAGGENVAAAIDGYKPMNAEALIAAAPEIVLTTDAHADRMGGLDDIFERPDIALTPAGEARRGALLDALLFLGMGPRTPAGIAAVADAIRAPGAAPPEGSDG